MSVNVKNDKKNCNMLIMLKQCTIRNSIHIFAISTQRVLVHIQHPGDGANKTLRSRLWR